MAKFVTPTKVKVTKPQKTHAKPHKDCPECLDSKMGRGLKDEFTLCPSCKGTGEV